MWNVSSLWLHLGHFSLITAPWLASSDFLTPVSSFDMALSLLSEYKVLMYVVFLFSKNRAVYVFPQIWQATESSTSGKSRMLWHSVQNKSSNDIKKPTFKAKKSTEKLLNFKWCLMRLAFTWGFLAFRCQFHAIGFCFIKALLSVSMIAAFCAIFLRIIVGNSKILHRTDKKAEKRSVWLVYLQSLISIN